MFRFFLISFRHEKIYMATSPKDYDQQKTRFITAIETNYFKAGAGLRNRVLRFLRHVMLRVTLQR